MWSSRDNALAAARSGAAVVFAASFVFAAAAAVAAPGPAPTALGDGGAPVALVAHAEALPDPSGDLDVAAAVASGAAFRPAASLDLGATELHPRTYWLRFRVVRSGSAGTWCIVLRGSVGRADLYVPRGDGTFEHLRGGLDVAAADDALGHRLLVLPASAYGTTSYLRVVEDGDAADLTLESLASGALDVDQRDVLHAFFIGYFLAIAALYLLLYAILRERPLLQYSAIMVSMLALLAVDSGAVWAWLPPTFAAQRTLVHDLLLNAYFLLLALFTTTFLRLLARDRAAFAAVAVATLLNALGLIGDFVDLPDRISDLGLPVTLAYFATLFFAGARAWRAGMRSARFFTLAVAMILLGYLLNGALQDPAVSASLHLPWLAIWSFEAAIALEALLLGIAVTERIRETARDYERLLMASRELEDLALRDGLTQVLNRRAFDRGLADAWHAAAARRLRLGLLMLDVDFFKSYNDRYGHQAGDACLRAVARACEGCVRGGDLFARYGGEEFAAIVPNATLEELEAIAQRMRAAVAELAIPHETPAGRVTLSIGGAVRFASDIRTEHSLVMLADAALYRAKETGRDRAVVDRETQAPAGVSIVLMC